MSHFYIVDSAISMLLIMNMNVMMILHGILMMAIHLMPLILINPSQCTQLNQLMHICTCSLTIKLQSFMFQEMNGLLKHLFQKTHVSPTIRNCLVIMRILWIWRKTDKLIHHICVACTTAKMLQCLPTNEVSTIVSHHYDDVLKRRFHMIPHAFGHTKFTFGKLWTRLFC